MKKTIHYVAIAMRFYNNGKSKRIFKKECETLDGACEAAKEFLMKRQWNVKNGEMIKYANEISESDMIFGYIYCQQTAESRSSESEFWEEYISIIPRAITWKTKFKEAFWDFISYIFAPVFIVKGIVLGLKILKNEPIDKVYKMRDEIKNTKPEDRYELYDRYFGEEE